MPDLRCALIPGVVDVVLLTPVTVTTCAVLQFPVVNRSGDGETVATPASSLASVTTTSAAGSVRSATL